MSRTFSVSTVYHNAYVFIKGILFHKDYSHPNILTKKHEPATLVP
jgi:hypothetical protein